MAGSFAYSLFRSLNLHRFQVEVRLENSGPGFVGTNLKLVEVLVQPRVEDIPRLGELNVGAELAERPLGGVAKAVRDVIARYFVE